MTEVKLPDGTIAEFPDGTPAKTQLDIAKSRIKATRGGQSPDGSNNMTERELALRRRQLAARQMEALALAAAAKKKRQGAQGKGAERFLNNRANKRAVNRMIKEAPPIPEEWLVNHD